MALVGTAPPPTGIVARQTDAPLSRRVAPTTWAIQTTRLRFALGDVTLGHWGLRVLVDQQHFADRAPLGAGWFEPAELAGDVDGTLVRGQPISAELPRHSHGDRFFRYVPRQYDRCTVDLTTTWDEYLARFSSKTRSTLRRKVRRFEEATYGLDFRVYREPGDLHEFFPAALWVSRQTYQARRLGCGLPEGEAFRAEAESLARIGNLRGYVLFAHGEPAAYLYCPLRAGVVEYAYVGHDPHLAELSPGTVLLFLALESLFGERGQRLFDFTEGDGPHKQLFASHTARCADIYTLRRTTSLVAVTRAHAVLSDLSTRVGQALDGIGLKRWLRRRLRGEEC